MQLEELRRLVTEVQQRRMEPDVVQVKAAAQNAYRDGERGLIG